LKDGLDRGSTPLTSTQKYSEGVFFVVTGVLGFDRL